MLAMHIQGLTRLDLLALPNDLAEYLWDMLTEYGTRTQASP